MKRILFSITGTVLGLVALLSFKSHSSPVTGAGALPAPTPPGPSNSPGRHGTRSQGPTTSRPAPVPRSRRSTSGTSPTATTVLGRPIQTPYEVVQVRVSISGSRITKVSYARLTSDNFTSQQINRYVAPILVRQTLQAQSAHINGVSGASYTSAGYQQSLQSALDKAGLR